MLEKYFLLDGSWNLDDPRIRKVQGSTCLAPLMYSSYRMMDGVVFRSPSASSITFQLAYVTQALDQ